MCGDWPDDCNLSWTCSAPQTFPPARTGPIPCSPCLTLTSCLPTSGPGFLSGLWARGLELSLPVDHAPSPEETSPLVINHNYCWTKLATFLPTPHCFKRGSFCCRDNVELRRTNGMDPAIVSNILIGALNLAQTFAYCCKKSQFGFQETYQISLVITQ